MKKNTWVLEVFILLLILLGALGATYHDGPRLGRRGRGEHTLLSAQNVVSSGTPDRELMHTTDAIDFRAEPGLDRIAFVETLTRNATSNVGDSISCRVQAQLDTESWRDVLWFPMCIGGAAGTGTTFVMTLVDTLSVFAHTFDIQAAPSAPAQPGNIDNAVDSLRLLSTKYRVLVYTHADTTGMGAGDPNEDYDISVKANAF